MSKKVYVSENKSLEVKEDVFKWKKHHDIRDSGQRKKEEVVRLRYKKRKT